MTVFFLYETYTAQESGKQLQWWAAVHSCPFLSLQRWVAKVASGLFYCWSLLRNNNMATNLQRFTLYYGSRRFVAWDCWTQTFWQVMQQDNDMLIATYIHILPRTFIFCEKEHEWVYSNASTIPNDNQKVPHFKSTDLNRIQVTIRSLAATCKLNSATALCWLLPPVIVM